MSCENDIVTRKAQMRKLIREKRRELSSSERERSAAAVAEALLSIEKLRGAEYVLAYMPMKYELDILPAVEKLRKIGVKPVFPLCVENGGLRLFIPAKENGFKVGAYGILEPNEETAQEIEAEELDAILLPAIGFDRNGYRLGQGGGYYDRLLAKTDCLRIAVGFNCQLMESIPVEDTDQRVDIVVTPDEIMVI
ncbi:MAG: 5-formyltetrahydrofolate cyclo-ligase [Clostridia bacterium]|nr:5-formyltetrahydrofolate cyclo-ligase [Clostridia bacterium]MBR3460321.1 5-formyltetrahydrofolate cyclo-ligase [Clostridia bacterium]